MWIRRHVYTSFWIDWIALLAVLFSSFPRECDGQCFEGKILEDNKKWGVDCASELGRSNFFVKRELGDPFTPFNMDDFCLRAGISDSTPQPNGTQSNSTNSNLTYSGVGMKEANDSNGTWSHLKTFTILETLVKGKAWSYQAGGRIDIVSMNFSKIKVGYDELYKKKVTLPLEEADRTNATLMGLKEAHDKYTTAYNSPSPGLSPLDPTGTFNAMAPIKAKEGLVKHWEDRIDVCIRSRCQCWWCNPSSRPVPSNCYSCECPCVANDVPHWNVYLKNERARRDYYQRQINAYTSSSGKYTADIKNLQEAAKDAKLELSQLNNLKGNLDRFPTPDYNAPNPYFVEVTGIKVDKQILKNFLHIRVFMNRSVSDAKSNLHSSAERKDRAYGRIKGLLLMVKDQEGWPVGEFSKAIPCKKTCSKYGKPISTHDDNQNVLPCSYTPPTATTHPEIFVWPSDGQEIQKGKSGVLEVHATWSFSQDSCNFVSELHFQTLIMEDFVERPGTDFFQYNSKGDIVGGSGRPHLFGWTAQYNILHPTKNSLGAADFVSIMDLKEFDRRGKSIDCHVPLGNDSSFGFVKGRIPDKVPSHSAYFLQLMSEFPPTNSSDVHYFGQHMHVQNGEPKCREPAFPKEGTVAIKILDEFLAVPVASEFMKANPGIRCPCPALPTTPGPDDATPDPSRVHGRLLHASHMALAWMVLVPLAFFVGRFYKETFSTVFCFQEYWWYMWHVVLMLAATAFVMGGILSISARKHITNITTTELVILHNIIGAISIIVFYIQIITGFFRSADPIQRMRGIFLHWLVGTLNHVLAIACVIMMGFQSQSGMSCAALIACGAWIIFYILMFGIMEFNLRMNDRKLQLKPKRSFLPPPVKRLFGQDAPGRIFRIIMLGVFIIGLLIFYFVIINFIWSSGGESCEDEYFAHLGKEEEEKPDYEDTYDYHDPLDTTTGTTQ